MKKIKLFFKELSIRHQNEKKKGILLGQIYNNLSNMNIDELEEIKFFLQ